MKLNFERARPFGLKWFFPGGFECGAVGIGFAAKDSGSLVEEQSVHRVGFGAGILADPVGGELHFLAADARFNGASFSVEFAADPVGVGGENSAAVLERFVAPEVVFAIGHELGGFGQ